MKTWKQSGLGDGYSMDYCDGSGMTIFYLYSIHTALDMVGIADPTFVCDGTNSLLYLFEGNYADSGISAAAMIPYMAILGRRF